MRFKIRKKEKGYVDVNKWVPLSDPDVTTLRRLLTFTLPTVDSNGIPETLTLWKESDYHLIIPRETPTERKDFIDLRPKPDKINVRSNITLDAMHSTNTQTQAINSWKKRGRGILNLACGKGKTVVALEAIARYNEATAVIVNNTNLLKQWELRIAEHLEGADVGIVQGPPNTWEWSKDITLCMLDTLCYHKDKVPYEFRRRPGVVIYDEIHHIAATYFSYTADLFFAKRFGLTATERRGDGLEPVYYYNVGNIFYSDLKQDIVPNIIFQFTPFVVDINSGSIWPQVVDKRGEFNLSKFRGYVGQLEERNAWIAEYLIKLGKLGKKILAISHCKKQLYLLRDILVEKGATSVGVATGNEPAENRLNCIEKSSISLGTSQLVKENLDVKNLDTLVLLTPFGRSTPGANSVQQSFGRILRPVQGKKPYVIILAEPGLPPFYRMSIGMMRLLDRWPEAKGGKMKYTIVREGEFPNVE